MSTLTVESSTVEASSSAQPTVKTPCVYLSWELPDPLWEIIEPLLPPQAIHLGRPRTVNLRQITAGIFYVSRTGIQWQAVPRERFGPPSTVYAYFAVGVTAGAIEHLWAAALDYYDDLHGLEWQWQSIDGAMTKAPLGGSTRPSPTGCGKRGTKRGVLTEGKGIPIAIVVAGANRNDMKVLEQTLDAIVIDRPEPIEEKPQNPCGDKGYDYDECREAAIQRQYIPHIWTRGEEKKAKVEYTDHRPRRWMVEVCHSWLNRFRKILVRFEKRDETHLALLQFACAYIVLKRAGSF